MKRGRLAQIKADAKREGWLKYIKTEQDERALLEGFIFDVLRGLHVVEFFESFLVHSKGRWAGKPFVLQPWQRDDIVLPVFSWVHSETGLRRFHTCQIWVPKKNGKSTLAAGFTLYLAVGDGEAGAQVYCAAVDRAQAGIVLGEAANMVEASESLNRRATVIRSQKRIRFEPTVFIQAVSADAATSQGIDAHGVVIDEIHAFDEGGRDLVGSLEHSGAARDQPLKIIISTAGDNPDGVGYEEYEYAKRVQEGKDDCNDVRTFAYIREADKDDDWTSLDTWRKANPSADVTMSADRYLSRVAEAQNNPRKIAVLKRYLLNIWILSMEPMFDVDRWDRLKGAWTLEDMRGRTCFAGFDASATQDLTACALAFPPEEEDKPIRIACRFWIPDENIEERERKDGVPYQLWADQGWVTLTPGPAVDYEIMYQDISDLIDTLDLREIRYDPWNAKATADRLSADGGSELIKIPQTFAGMSNPTKAFEIAILSAGIEHDGNPILRWNIRNVVPSMDSKDNYIPNKRKSKKRIDGAVGAIMAFDGASGAEGPGSVYDDDGPGLTVLDV